MILTPLWTGRRFLGTSYGAPTENGSHAITAAKNESKKVVAGINEFFASDWKTYIQKIKALPMDIFKEYDEIKIE